MFYGFGAVCPAPFLPGTLSALSLSPPALIAMTRITSLRHILCLSMLSVAWGTLGLTDSSAAADQPIDYTTRVQPILEAHCFDCHGPDTRESGLRLDRRSNLLRGGDSGEPAVIPGNAAASHLVQLIAGKDPKRQMPPDGERLTAEQISILSGWIRDGATMPPELSGDEPLTTDHWSFQPIQRPERPDGQDSVVQSSVDAFVIARLQQEGLTLASRADSRTLIRRLFLVMHGLPPTPEQMGHWTARFAAVRDKSEISPGDSPKAFRDRVWRELVDEVLASPRYGERWARHWLDIIRFGETHGFETNRERPNAWHFRDYVIEAFNSDMPYDRFVREQIAGDVFGADVATGFLVAGPHDLVKSPDKNLTLMQRQDELSDLINVTGTTFLGLTLGCARCHNHKFDPILQRDFYSIQAVFAGVNHGDRALSPSADKQRQLDEISNRMAELQHLLTEFIPQATTERILLDDDPSAEVGRRGLRHLAVRAGQGTNPAGTDRGCREDPGGRQHSPNLSGGTYSWWSNEPGHDVAAYQPLARGRYRVWISWGCGHNSHTEDARYVLDADGNPATTDDQTDLATVNQKYFSDGTGQISGKSLWSGFYDSGVHEFLPASIILLRCGQSGTAISSDVVLLEAESQVADRTGAGPAEQAPEPPFPVLRSAVNAKLNTEHAQLTKARFLRFTVRQTNSSEPCLDELEVWDGDQNVALAAHGTTATSSGNLPGYEIHQLKHINDGRHGNNFSWISNQSGKGWVQLEFPRVEKFDRITWGRDRDGRFSDRLPTDYVIEASVDGQDWHPVATSGDRLPFDPRADASPVYQFTTASPARAALGKGWYDEWQQLRQRRSELSQSEQIYAGTFSQPPATFRLYRGDPLAPREQVSPDTLEVMGSLGLATDAPEQRRRGQFAEWLASPDNPLTARVIVNRLWQHHFGTGIVGTPNDFGKNGTPPSHPRLLDWLAAELIHNGWSLKHIHRRILLSATWQQDSSPGADGIARDAGTRLLWRFPPRRLEAEAIRDSILAVSGALDVRMGGRGFSGFEVQMENVRHFFPKTSYGPEDYRRMIYMTKVRQEQESVFGAFDCPDASQVISRRSRSTTPLQALNLINSPFILQQAELFSQRLQAEAGSAEDRIQQAFQLCFGRAATNEDLSDSTDFISQYGLPAFCRALLNANEFLFVP